jgi:hypothetical protein
MPKIGSTKDKENPFPSAGKVKHVVLGEGSQEKSEDVSITGVISTQDSAVIQEDIRTKGVQTRCL